jgi:hypothetical protein
MATGKQLLKRVEKGRNGREGDFDASILDQPLQLSDALFPGAETTSQADYLKRVLGTGWSKAALDFAAVWSAKERASRPRASVDRQPEYQRGRRAIDRSFVAVPSPGRTAARRANP